jgi:hypothetical protein
MKIVNVDARVVNKLETPLTDDARVVIYNRHMFIVPATGYTARGVNYSKNSFMKFAAGCHTFLSSFSGGDP